MPRRSGSLAERRYRYRWVTPIRQGHWCDTIDAAKEAAAKAKVAHKDDYGRIFMDVFTRIESEELEQADPAEGATKRRQGR